MMRISKHGGFIGRYVVSRPLVTYSEAVRRLEKHNLVRGRLVPNEALIPACAITVLTIH